MRERESERECVCERERECVCERERECVCERERECVCERERERNQTTTELYLQQNAQLKFDD